MSFTTAATNLLSQLTSTWIIAIFTILLTLGLIAEMTDWHNRSWQWVFRTLYIGGFTVGASALVTAVL